MLTWNVYIGDFNGKRIETHNIFDHGGVMEDLRKIARKYKEREAFEAEVRRTLMYYYWSKCEWEIILSHWPPRKDARDEKIDVWDQVHLNWPIFIDYLWENRKELTSRKRKETSDG